MKKITLDYSQSLNLIEETEIINFQESVSKYHDKLHRIETEERNCLGWVDHPKTYNREEFSKIKRIAEKIRNQSQVFVVIGIGGSYLGARAAIEMFNKTYLTKSLKNTKQNLPEIYFAGFNLSTYYYNQLFQEIEGKDISINIISKSGTTTESSISFRILKEYMENKYGKNGARERIFVTTDERTSVLKIIAEKEGYEAFGIPQNIGGRYSVLTSVGLLPMAVAGIDIDMVMEGARSAYEDLYNDKLDSNMAYQYAAIRNILYSRGKEIEIMASYEPNMYYFGEWYKQLFGESEGKKGKGIFPTSLNFTADLHSMGQYIQEGKKNIFETTVNIEEIDDSIVMKETEDNLDGLNYLSGKTLDFINKRAMEGVIKAHYDGGVPNIVINIPKVSPYYLGYLMYFFQKACGISGYLLGVNPFNQPGVEAYKKNMFHILGKPGY